MYKQTTARSYKASTTFQFKVLGSCEPPKHFLVGKLLEGMKRQNIYSDLCIPITFKSNPTRFAYDLP